MKPKLRSVREEGKRAGERGGDHDVARRKGAYGITYYPLGLQIWEVKFFTVVQGTF